MLHTSRAINNGRKYSAQYLTWRVLHTLTDRHTNLNIQKGQGAFHQTFKVMLRGSGEDCAFHTLMNQGQPLQSNGRKGDHPVRDDRVDLLCSGPAVISAQYRGGFK